MIGYGKQKDDSQMKEEWEIVKSTSIVKDKWIDLRADTCLSPQGRQLSPYYVLSYPDWVNIVAITDEGNIVLVRQYRHAVQKVILEIPGGAFDASDCDGEAAARREFEEETGYVARKWEFISTLYPNPASHTNRLHIYLATGATPKHTQRLDQGEEGLTVHLLSISDVLTGMRSGLVGQALQVSSVFLALQAYGQLGCCKAASIREEIP
uniref:GDP-mannose pyrophosphatase n=2 Tax=Rhizobium rhizogenes TaxID=359 RepID=A0A7S5DRS6_RHIRH|nr:NUDIX domain protein [Rhizobium rhizogenes]